jgi:hypothetical protein
VDGLTAAGRAAALVESESGGIQVVSDLGDNTRQRLETPDSDRGDSAPEEAAETVQRIAEVHKVSTTTVLTWLRAGLPYRKTGNWRTGAGFILHYEWTWAWLHSTASALAFHKEQHLLRQLRLEPYVDPDYDPGADA